MSAAAAEAEAASDLTAFGGVTFFCSIVCLRIAFH
jgi:hypothetical protein